jgi:hypothetical protein
VRDPKLKFVLIPTVFVVFPQIKEGADSGLAVAKTAVSTQKLFE